MYKALATRLVDQYTSLKNIWLPIQVPSIVFPAGDKRCVVESTYLAPDAPSLETRLSVLLVDFCASALIVPVPLRGVIR